jgi:antirestriction protein
LRRKGYQGKRDFMAGGMNEDTPKVYVADLEAYNNGKLVGEWLDLSDYNDADELMDAIQDFLKTSGGGEYAIHDYENLPSSMYSEYMGKRDFEEIYQMIDLAKDNNLPLEVAMEVVSQYGESALDEYNGVYDSAVDFAEELSDDIGIQSFIDFTYYLDISETDRRLLAQEMADGYVDDIRSEDEGRRLIEEGELDLDEFEEADYDRKEEMLDEARENVYNEYYDNWYEGLDDPYTFLVEEQGLYDDESFVKANFVQVDYEKLADALEQDYTFIRHDGKVYVFNIR